MTPKLLIVEDDAALAELLVWNFEAQGYKVTHTPDGEEALLLAEEISPDLILLDWMIENISGLEVCRRLRRKDETSAIPIIMLTARGEEEDRIRGLDTGADDYVTKPFSPKELVARATAVLRRSKPAATGKMITVGTLQLDPATHRVRRDGQDLDMGPTEFRLLTYFMERPGRVLSRAQLIDGVWSHDAEIDERTVDVHIRRLRKAINGEDGLDFIRTVRSAGYAFESAS
jgi:two-component system, OmpR family, phosphate regulon response regulator PhoB